MQPFPVTVVLRHRKENLKKCSLRGLESREDFRFYSYPQEKNEALPELDNYIFLDIDAPPLSISDATSGLLVIDATWRYAEAMAKYIKPKLTNIKYRSIPRIYRTAYPRYQTACPLPEYGLASVEAIYVAYKLLGRNTDGLLDNYYWKQQFLQQNVE